MRWLSLTSEFKLKNDIMTTDITALEELNQPSYLGDVSGSFLSTPKHYRKYMFMYGILSVLFVLEYYEYEEEYEECQKIIDAIKEQEKALETTLFTTITTESIKEVVETYKKFNLTGKNAIDNSKYYSTLILKEIEASLRVH